MKNLDDHMKGAVYAGLTALLWGFLPIILKFMLSSVDPLTISWFRFFLAFSVLLAYFLAKEPHQARILIKPPRLLIIGGIGLGFNYVLYINGVGLTSPSNAQVIIQLAPVFLALVGFFAFKEKLSTVQTLGFILAVTGLFSFYQDQISNFLGNTGGYNLGVLLVVLSALAWVIYAGIQKKMVKSHPAQQLNLVVYGVPALFLLPFVDFTSLIEAGSLTWVLLVFLGLNTLAAYGFLAEAFKYTDANKVGIIITLNPLITMVTMSMLGAAGVTWIEPEQISITGVFGAILVIFGAVLAVKRSKIKKEERKLFPGDDQTLTDLKKEVL